jgi:hypothetical protein
MKIRSFGCSFIFGTDLPDANENESCHQPSQLTWPALVAKQLHLDYKCYAHGGAGNLLILDKLLKLSALNPGDFFIINWTWIDRFDYSDSMGLHYGQGHNDWKTLHPMSRDKLSEIYYKNLHSEYRDKLTSLICIKTAIECLQEQQNKFLMTYTDDTMLSKIWHNPPGIEFLLRSVHPHLHSFDGKSFLDWSRDRGYAISETWHPLEQAHSAAADYMLPKIQDLLNSKKSLS